MLRIRLNPLVVIVNRNAQDALGMFLADNIFIQMRHDLTWSHDVIQMKFRCQGVGGCAVFNQDVLAKVNTVVADKHTVGASNQAVHFIVAPPTK
jgi:hypothetical protein